jgi:hypothetical protein
MTLIAVQAASPADTVVTVAARDVIDWLVAAAAGSVVLGALALVAALSFTIVLTRRMGKSIDVMRQKVSADPAMASLRRTAENVSSISETVRGQVELFSESVGRVSDQITRASLRIEERVHHLNALLEVVQSEAEGAFVDSAAAARGIRASLGAFRDGVRSRPEHREKSPSEPGDVGTPARARPLDVHPDDALLEDVGDDPDDGAPSQEKP